MNPRAIALFFLAGLVMAHSCNRGGEQIQKEQYTLFWSDRFVPGFERAIAGREFRYHSPHPDVDSALISRAMDGKMAVEWQTVPVPKKFPYPEVTFIWLAGLGCNLGQKRFELFVNGEKWFEFATVQDREWSVLGPHQTELSFRTTLVDRYGDHFGYMFLKIPISSFLSGKRLTIRVVGEKAESKAWFMVFRTKLQPEVKLHSEPVLVRENGRLKQNIRIEILNFKEAMKAHLSILGRNMERDIHFGHNSVRIPVPAMMDRRKVHLQLAVAGKAPLRRSFWLDPVRRIKVYLLPHSHVDIGYTAPQEKVKEIQWSHLEKAIELAEASLANPPESRFKWNTEQLWHVEAYLEEAAEEKKVKLIQALRKGWIGLDATFANMLTGLCRPEELWHIIAAGKRVASEVGIPIEAAMITDVPGYTWGLVPVLARSGVKYLSLGPNAGHRIGHVYAWADRPFYWVSPSGQEKILCWVHGKGYSYFHSGMNFTLRDNHITRQKIIPYVEELVKREYPYDIVAIRYSVGADNGPPDPYLSAAVKRWNEKYESPRLVISTTANLFRTFEKAYGSRLPRVRGDFTPYWEDGAASTARETASVRAAAEHLVQASAMWAMLRPGEYPDSVFEEAWRNVLLYDEHTWGAWNSISQPDENFVTSQWEWKKHRATLAHYLSKQVLKEAFRFLSPESDSISVVEIFNTNSWERTDLVELPSEWVLPGDRVEDDNGNPVPSQRLRNGKLAFVAANVPPFAGKRFHLKKGEPFFKTEVKVDGRTLSNEFLRAVVEGKSGAIAGLQRPGWGKEFVDRSVLAGLNDYIYVAGRDPENQNKISLPVMIRVKETGPVIASLLISSSAPGCDQLIREIRMIAGFDRLEILDELHRPRIRKPEGIHFGFPFLLPRAQIRVDSPWAVVRPEKDQIKGACKNWFTVQRWVDVSSREYGVTLAVPDAPLVEIGEIRADATVYGWIQHLPPSATLYSYVMNNYWETNYKADQPGITCFTYWIQPHRKYDQLRAEHFGIACSQPLLPVPVKKESPVHRSLFQLVPANILVTLLKPRSNGKEFLVRLFNPTNQNQTVEFRWQRLQPKAVYRKSPFQKRGQKIGNKFRLRPFEIETLRIERD